MDNADSFVFNISISILLPETRKYDGDEIRCIVVIDIISMLVWKYFRVKIKYVPFYPPNICIITSKLNPTHSNPLK